MATYYDDETGEDKEYLEDIWDFKGQYEGIDPEDYYRQMLNQDEDPNHDPEWCELERTDYVAFRTGANDHADAMVKSREWVTVDNGLTYHWARDAKEFIAENDPEFVEYPDELKEAFEFFMP